MCFGFESQTEILHLPSVLKVEPDWKLEIQLDGGTLVLSAKSVFDLNVDLSWNTERSDEHRGEINRLQPTSADTVLEWVQTQWGTIWMDAVSQLAVNCSSKSSFPSILAGRTEKSFHPEPSAGCVGVSLSF